MPSKREKSERRAWLLLQDRVEEMTEAQLQATYDSILMPSAPKLFTSFRRVLREQIASLRERRRVGWPERTDTDADEDAVE
jgi:hypothetical protein